MERPSRLAGVADAGHRGRAGWRAAADHTTDIMQILFQCPAGALRGFCLEMRTRPTPKRAHACFLALRDELCALCSDANKEFRRVQEHFGGVVPRYAARDDERGTQPFLQGLEEALAFYDFVSKKELRLRHREIRKNLNLVQSAPPTAFQKKNQMTTQQFHEAVRSEEEWSEEIKDEFRLRLPEIALNLRQEIKRVSEIQLSEEDDEWDTFNPSVDIQKQRLRVIYAFILEEKIKCLQAIHKLREVLTDVLDGLSEADEVELNMRIVSDDEDYCKSFQTSCDKPSEGYRQFAVFSKVLYEQFLIEYHGFFGS